MTFFLRRSRWASLSIVTVLFSSLVMFASHASAAIKPGTYSFVDTSAHTEEFLSIPPFLARETGKPSVILSFDVSAAMLVPAYAQAERDWRAQVLDNFFPDTNYTGYFDSAARYRYDAGNGFFVATENGVWNGNFLNWLTMRRIDIARQAAVGGKVRNRAGQNLNGTTLYVLEGEAEQRAADAYRKSYSASLGFSAIPDNTPVTISHGRIEWTEELESEPATEGCDGWGDICPDPAEPELQLFSFNIAVAKPAEPQGFVQANSAAINFGLSVFNFDHKVNTLAELVEGNQVNGQTLHPCYYIFDEPLRTRRHVAAATDPNSAVSTVTLYDGNSRDYLCIPTGVHAPNDKIVQVIEEYPIIEGTAPLAEAMVDIGNYVRQAAPRYPNVESSNSASARTVANSPQAVYGIGNAWDPFFDTAQNQTVECKKIFALYIGAGESSGDFDGVSDPTGAPELSAINGESHDLNEALDNVALALRQNDCRDDAGSADMNGHQEVVSYYVHVGSDGGANADATRRLREAAARGGFLDLNNDQLPDPLTLPEGLDFNTYAGSNPTPGQSSPEHCPANEWDRNSDCEPDAFFLAESAVSMAGQLQMVISSMMSRVASGGGASVMSGSNGGDGVLYQASFYPDRSAAGESVKWTGDVSALILDRQGYLRSDDGDGVIETFAEDPIVDTCFDTVLKQVRVALSSDPAERPTAQEAAVCRSGSPFSLGLEDIGYLWSAADFLSSLNDTQARTQRSDYASADGNRYIKTLLNIDTDGDGIANPNYVDFIPASFNADNFGLLDAENPNLAGIYVDYIRGVDFSFLRSRQLNSKTQRLGDVIYSTPTPVGKPSENLHLLYDDASYFSFYQQYRNRRTMVYVGGNDGMLHAFNAGWYDRTNQSFSGVRSGYTEWVLGQEVWAYVPFNLLPHLRQLTRPEYGQTEGHHMFFVDQSPYVFDARIFDDVEGQPDTTNADGDPVATHPNGWGTVLVVGFRTGGGEVSVYPDPQDQNYSVTVRPAYLIFDITDPEQEPRLLAEFTHEKLGLSFSEPTALTIKNTSGGTDWYLAFGSGPSATPNGVRQVVSEQNAQLLMLNLKTLALDSGFGTQGVLDLGEANAFVGDMVAADFDLDVNTDALYFGTTQGIDNLGSDGLTGTDGLVDAWAGKLLRTRIQPGASASSHNWKVEVMLDPQLPISNRPSVSFDSNLNRWLHVGTGRFFTAADTVDASVQALFGVKESRAEDGAFAMDSYANTVPAVGLGDLVDVSDSEVEEASGTLSGVSGFVNVAALNQRMMQYGSSSDYLPGWKKYLTAGERAMGSARLLGGVITQSTYRPDLLPCSFSGEARLYALRYITGTASEQHVFADPSLVRTNDAVLESVSTGTAPTVTPGIHLGESRASGEATLVNIGSDMSITITTEQNLQGLDSRETSWRGL